MEKELTKSKTVLDILENKKDELISVSNKEINVDDFWIVEDAILGFDEAEFKIYTSPKICALITLNKDTENCIIDENNIPEDGCQKYCSFDNFTVYRDIFALKDYLMIV